MLGEPVRADYSSYGAYALAAVGYAYITQGGYCPSVIARSGGCLDSGGCRLAVDGSGSVARLLASGTCRCAGYDSEVAGGVGHGCGDGVADSGCDCSGSGVDSSISAGGGASTVEREGLRIGPVDSKIRGKHYTKNRNKKEAKRRAKRVAASDSWIKDREARSDAVCDSVDEVKRSLQNKWKAQNDLAVAKAERDLEVLRAVDVASEVKRRRTALALQVERNMVGMEKAHSFLQSTGNGGGSVETVVSDGDVIGESISPNSSASMAEFRAMHKALLDAEAKNLELERKLDKISQKLGKDCQFVDYFDKRTWTDTPENRNILNEVYPDGYGELAEYCEEGKFQVIEC